VLSAVPGALIVVVVGILMNESFRLLLDGFYLRAEDGHLVSLPAGGAADFFGQLTLPDWSRWTDRRIYTIGFTLAIVASIESLLSLEASDKIDPQRRISSPDRELLAQGVGNVAAGLLGGLPVTAVIVRSSANVYAGAKSRWSAIVHGVLLLVSVVAIPRLLNLIPLASLAAVLLMIGFKLTKPKLYRDIWASGVDQFVPFIITVLAIIFTDVLTGVVIGIVFGVIFVIRTNHHAAFTLVHQDSMYLLRLNKDASFVNKTELKLKLASIPADSGLIVDGTRAVLVDRDIYDVLADFSEGAPHRGIEVEFKNFHQKSQNFRKRSRAYGIV
jgi:MFS superfamily sulfate permease-like transporter